MTLAPELEGAAEVIAALRATGVVVSLGHSGADAVQARRAFNQGVGMLTHSFNAMAGLHHRAPGPVGEALRQGEVALGLIADGVHVDPTMAVLLQRLAPRQVVIVSDALAPYGLADGRHRWDERVLLVEDGSCRLEDGTLAGVTLPLLEGAAAGRLGRPGAGVDRRGHPCPAAPAGGAAAAGAAAAGAAPGGHPALEHGGRRASGLAAAGHGGRRARNLAPGPRSLGSGPPERPCAPCPRNCNPRAHRGTG